MPPTARQRQRAASIGGTDVLRVPRPRLERLVGLMEQEISWRRQPLSQLLGLSPDDGSAAEPLLRTFGAEPLVADLPAGFETRLGSEDLSFDEGRTIKLVELLASERRILLLDDPPIGRPVPDAGALIARMTGDRQRTWVLVSSVPVDASAFDQVLELEGGRVVFLGSPADWAAGAHDLRLWGVAAGC